MTPKEIPTPSPIFNPLLFPDVSGSGIDVVLRDSAPLVDTIEVVAGVAVVIVAGSMVTVLLDIVLWETEPVAELRVAPRGVIKELVTTIVFSATDDPTSSE